MHQSGGSAPAGWEWLGMAAVCRAFGASFILLLCSSLIFLSQERRFKCRSAHSSQTAAAAQRRMDSAAV
jgi:hypothetical protein